MKNNVKTISKVLKALSDESRLNILQEISNSTNKCIVKEGDSSPESCVRNISEDLKLAKSTVSHHIKVLLDSEVISTNKKGRHIYCDINQDTLSDVIKYLSKLQKE